MYHLSNMPTQKDEQIEFWLDQVKEILSDTSRTKQEKEPDLDDLEEQIKDRLDDPNLNFSDDYVDDVMSRITNLRGIDSLPK